MNLFGSNKSISSNKFEVQVRLNPYLQPRKVEHVVGGGKGGMETRGVADGVNMRAAGWKAQLFSVMRKIFSVNPLSCGMKVARFFPMKSGKQGSCSVEEVQRELESGVPNSFVYSCSIGLEKSPEQGGQPLGLLFCHNTPGPTVVRRFAQSAQSSSGFGAFTQQQPSGFGQTTGGITC